MKTSLVSFNWIKSFLFITARKWKQSWSFCMQNMFPKYSWMTYNHQVESIFGLLSGTKTIFKKKTSLKNNWIELITKIGAS